MKILNFVFVALTIIFPEVKAISITIKFIGLIQIPIKWYANIEEPKNKIMVKIWRICKVLDKY